MPKESIIQFSDGAVALKESYVYDNKSVDHLIEEYTKATDSLRDMPKEVSVKSSAKLSEIPASVDPYKLFIDDDTEVDHRAVDDHEVFGRLDSLPSLRNSPSMLLQIGAVK